MFSHALTILTLWLCVTAQSNNSAGIYYRPGDLGVTAPVATFQPEPDYTKHARDKKIQGTVRLSVLLGPEGKVDKAKVINSLDPGLDENAVKTVQTWKFTPCQKDGQPVRCVFYVEVSYRLR
jgi:periplasmic protein TonB